MKRILFILVIILYLSSCTCEPVIYKQYIRDTIIKIAPPIITDTGKPQIITDTLIEYIREKGKDTIIRVKYLPKERIITVYAKPDTINLFRTDTLSITEVKEVPQSTPLKDFFMYAMGFILLIILFYFAYKYLESKYNAVNTK